MIRRALILANFAKEEVRELASELRPWLAARVDEVGLETDIRAFCLAREASDRATRSAAAPDLVIVLGGDGALLGAVRAFAAEPVRTLGINLGRVGFLASTPATRWRDTLEHVLRGECKVEHRMRLRAEWTDAQGETRSMVALNDVTLQRDSHQGMLRASLSVGDDWVTEYRADGLILATPSGSTAYSLSAGGPILVPAVEALVVTPICSQGLANRPIVLDAGSAFTIQLNSPGSTTTLVVDGQAYHSLEHGDELRVTRHPERYPLYAMPGLDPYRRLRDRLGWGGAPVNGAG